nr:ATP-binding protein [Streptomyces hirsutus]
MVTVAPPHPWVYALRLPHDPRAVRVARVTVRAALDGHGMQDAVDVVELLTSELVTNAYLHTKGPASLRLTGLGDGRLRVGVWDSDPYIPAPFSGACATPSRLLRPTPKPGAGCVSCGSTPTPGAVGPSVTVHRGEASESCSGSK